MKAINWRYILGEILIVIIGISIAFALNKIAENSKDNSLRQQYLLSIRSDIKVDREGLLQNLDVIKGKIAVADEPLPILNRDIDGKMQFIGKIFEFVATIPIDYTYNALINSGDYKFISDFDTIKAIEKHYSSYKALL